MCEFLDFYYYRMSPPCYTRRMKRFITAIAILLTLLLCACAEGFPVGFAQSPAPTQLLTPSPSPTPEIPRVIAVFGAEDADAFLSGVEDAAKDTGIEILAVSGGLSALASYDPEGDAAAIVYLSGNSKALPQTNFPVYVFSADGQAVSADLPHLTYDETAATKIALENALTYPPHLSPVRMIGLFSGEGSAAYALWQAAATNGIIFEKGLFFADTSETPLADWLNDTILRYYPGALDCVFAESGALAVAAADVLAGLGRDDIEVFSAGTDAETAEKLSPILLCAVGLNLADAGARCFAEAEKLLSGGAAASDTLLPESFWYSVKP